MNSYHRVMAAINREPVDRVPVYPLVMLFAAQHVGTPYSDYVLDYRRLVAAQLECVRRYGYDVVSVCSDAYRESHACGSDIEFPEDDVPRLRAPVVRTEGDLARLKVPDPLRAERMVDRVRAVAAFREAVGGEYPIQGWIESPFQGASVLRGLTEFLVDLHERPAFAHDFLDFMSEMEIAFALAQIEAGADIVGAGDGVATLVSPEMFEEFVLPYVSRVFKAIEEAGAAAKYHICGDTNHLLELITRVGNRFVNIDYMVDLGKAKRILGRSKICIKGNLNPASHLLLGTREEVARASAECLRVGGDRGYMLSPGCEVPRYTPPENMEAMVAAAAGGG